MYLEIDSVFWGGNNRKGTGNATKEATPKISQMSPISATMFTILST